jgi:hypothetical protein
MAHVKTSEIWQHVKSGGLYRIVSDAALNEADLRQLVIYESLFDGQIWASPGDEFYDGRFRNLAVDEITDCRPAADKQ